MGRRSRWPGRQAARKLVADDECKQNESMPNVLIRNLPDDVHAALQRKAELHHQSLQQYLATELRRLSERRPIGDLLDEIELRDGGRVGLRQAARDVSAERVPG